MPLFRLIFISLLLIGNSAVSQTGFHGIVKDTANKPIYGVIISILDSASSKILYYTTSNNEGFFKVENQYSSKQAILQFSSLSYETQTFPIPQNNSINEFVLQNRYFVLPNVIVHSQKPINFHGDTLDYNVKHFSKASDRTIGDVIKNLPGINISTNGTISYNGKPISKFYIDDDDLLGSKYAIANNTIPVDVVDKIQIYENHQPIRMFHNKYSSDDVALNLQLNKNYKTKIFGSGKISEGLPINKSADIEMNAFLFKSHVKILNSYKFNNTGFSFEKEREDHFPRFGNNSDLDYANKKVLFTESISKPQLPDEYFQNNTSHLLSLNTSFKNTNGHTIRINLFGLPDKNKISAINNDTYSFVDTKIVFTDSLRSTQQIKPLYFNLTYVNNSENNFFQNEFKFQKDNFTENYTTNRIKGNIFHNYTTNYFNISNYFDIKKEFSNKFLLNIDANISFSSVPENSEIADSSQYPFPEIGNLKLATQHLTKQSLLILSNAKIYKTFESITMSLNSKISLQKTKYMLNSLFDYSLADNYENNLEQLFWNHNNIYTEPRLDYNKKRLRIAIAFPASYNSINITKKNYRTFDTICKNLSFVPYLKMNYKLSNFLAFDVTLKRDISFTDPSRLFTTPIFKNYRTLIKDSQNVQFNPILLTSIFISYRNPLKITFANMGFLYSKSFLENINYQIIGNESLLSGTIPLRNNTNRYVLLGGFSKYIIAIRLSIKASYNNSIFNYTLIQNNILQKVKQNNQNITIESNGIINKLFNYYITTTWSNTRFSSQNIDTKNASLNLFKINCSADLTLKTNLLLKPTFAFIKNISEHFPTQVLSDIKLNYIVPKSKNVMGFQIYNLFNDKKFILTDKDNFKTTETIYSVRPRTLIIYFTFRF